MEEFYEDHDKYENESEELRCPTCDSVFVITGASAPQYCPYCGREIEHEEPEPAPPPEPPSYDDMVQRYINDIQDEQETAWQRAAKAFYVTERMQVKPSAFAADVGCSATLIREQARTFRAFADEETRVPTLSFYHHRLAAKTDDPAYWIAQAADNMWSTRQMAQGIRGQTIKDELRTAETAWSKVLRIIDAGGEPAEWLRQQIANYKF